MATETRSVGIGMDPAHNYLKYSTYLRQKDMCNILSDINMYHCKYAITAVDIFLY